MAGFSRALVLLCFFFSFSEARDHLVGGKADAWKIPSSESDSLNQWAEKSRFLIGDSLVWKHDGNKDSVLQVTKKDYVTCNNSSPIEAYNGNTKVKLERPGPFYFISGVEGHCENGQKLIVVVMSEKHRRFMTISPAPSPVEFEGTAIAPASGAASLKGSLMVASGVLIGVVWM
ncbi:unnamed protein product [Ilex paraguariensis]|uniref:Phytocyanin domain-containing protein n=1 Tax=Ilex paraguariensis TaxID=185542 RepID=A0ABC8RYA2_9AQUA